MNDMQTPDRPVRPKDAASLIIMRGTGPDAEILMGRRAPRHKFMPHMYVFPGGRLDNADLKAPVRSGLDQRPANYLDRQVGAEKGQGLAVAAARETWEETGLVFGHVEKDNFTAELSGIDYLGRAITPPVSPIRFHARFFFVSADRAVGGPDAPIGGSGELLDLAWRPLQECLKLPLVDVTEFMLEEVLRRQRGTAIEAVPLFSYKNGSPNISYQRLDR